MRITCVIGSLGGGGAERAMLYLCGGLATRGHEVTLLTLYDHEIPDFYTVPEAVKRVCLHLPPLRMAGVFGGIARVWKLTWALRATRPQVVISFITLNVLASCLLLGIPYIYADHLDVRRTPSTKWRIARSILLRRARAVTVLSKRDLKYLTRFFPKWKPVLVYNPALPCKGKTNERPTFFKPGKKYVLAVGRLTQQKGFDRLLEAWRRVCDTHEDWRLAIVGSGPDEAELKALAETLDVQYSVDFIPPQKELAAVYAHASVFAMSSRAEGFPLVLLEAMSVGLPAVSFACTGPDVIIRDDVDGFLVPQHQTDLFARKLETLMDDENLRRQFGKRAREVITRFSLQDYLDTYENLCRQALM